MFNRIAETWMHRIRWALAVGWWILIVSMFWDPVSAVLTDPATLWSPFRFTGTCAEFQGECLPFVPYPMGARIFWGMVIPFAVITLITFGHEAWRRICPLAFMSQIPRALGKQRHTSAGSGKRPQLVLIKPESWLGRNHLYVQMGLLFVGLTIRLVLVNSDRLALGIFLVFTIACALAVGYLFGGKSWCQYFCPMAPVQEIYNGPRGLLGSQAHKESHQGITQSMCRTVDPVKGGEKSVCVSCQSPCMDIDSERAYWERIKGQDRRLLYYGYLGLVLGFYFYFAFYSGNPNFLAGSVWLETHQLETILGPGFYVMGQGIPIPKVLAAPLTLATCVAVTYGLGNALEGWIQGRNQRRSQSLDPDLIRHRLFTLFSFTAFTCLYFFGVRPTLGWTQPLRPVVDWILVVVSSLWCYRTFWRTSDQYVRESLTQSLRRQLGKLSLDFGKFLGGKSLEELKPDELYVLSKVLPSFTREKRLETYREVLREALEDGSVDSSSSLKVLQTMRQQLGVSDQEHQALVQELGVADPSLLDPQHSQTREQRQRLKGYHQSLELMVLDAVEHGIPLQQALAQKKGQLQLLRQEYDITLEEDAQVFAEVLNPESMLVRAGDGLVQQLQTLAQRHQLLEAARHAQPGSIGLSVLEQFLSGQQAQVTRQLLGILEVLGETSEAQRLAPQLARYGGPPLLTLLMEDIPAWQGRLSPTIYDQLEHMGTQIRVPFGSSDRPALVGLLTQLLHEPDPMIQATAIHTLAHWDPATAQAQAQTLLQEDSSSGSDLDPLLLETLQTLMGQAPARGGIPTLMLEIQGSRTQEQQIWHQERIQIGRHPTNDVVLPDSRVSRQHAVLECTPQGILVRDLGSAHGTQVGSQRLKSSSHTLTSGDRLVFSPEGYPVITVRWDPDSTQGTSTLEKALILLTNPLFRSLSTRELLPLAQVALLQTYPPGSLLAKAGDPVPGLRLVVKGSVLEEERVRQQGDTLGEWELVTQGRYEATLKADVRGARLLFLDKPVFDALLDSHPQLSRLLLHRLGDRLHTALQAR